MQVSAYCVQWWDSLGRPHTSEPMDFQSAYTLHACMDVRQEAQIILVHQSGGTQCPTTTKESYHA